MKYSNRRSTSRSSYRRLILAIGLLAGISSAYGNAIVAQTVNVSVFFDGQYCTGVPVQFPAGAWGCGFPSIGATASLDSMSASGYWAGPYTGGGSASVFIDNRWSLTVPEGATTFTADIGYDSSGSSFFYAQGPSVELFFPGVGTQEQRSSLRNGINPMRTSVTAGTEVVLGWTIQGSVHPTLIGEGIYKSGGAGIYNIHFLDAAGNVIPEPGTFVLVGLGILAGLVKARRCR